MAGDVVEVRQPCRVDLAGGWSDVPEFAEEHGGHVVSLAVSPTVHGRMRWNDEGLDFSLKLNVPSDSHLGTSASSTVAYLRLINGLVGRERTMAEVAEDAVRLGRLTGEIGGKQDEYTAAFGGLLSMRFRGLDDDVEVDRIELSEEVRDEITKRLLVVHTGHGHSSGNTHERVWDRYRSGDKQVKNAILRLRDTAGECHEALLDGDLDRVGRLIDENRQLEASLDEEIVQSPAKAILAACESLGAAGKPCGAGGGGCILLLCNGADTNAVADVARERGGRVIPVEPHFGTPV